MKRTTLTTLLVSAGLALTLSACGNSNTAAVPAGSEKAAASTVAGIDAAHNDADVTFIKDMSPHHTGAIGMAELVADRSTNAKIKDLGSRILAAQQPELIRMAAMGKAWGAKLDGAGHSMSGMGSSMDDDVAALKPLTGVAFDRAFLARMLVHHGGALPMAKAELTGGQNPQGKALARAIFDAQTKEIAEMKALQADVA